jgi:hypothetical protein
MHTHMRYTYNTRAYTHTRSRYTHMCVHTHSLTHSLTCITHNTRAYTHTHSHIHTHTHTLSLTYTHACTHAQPHVHTNSHRHTQTHTDKGNSRSGEKHSQIKEIRAKREPTVRARSYEDAMLAGYVCRGVWVAVCLVAVLRETKVREEPSVAFCSLSPLQHEKESHRGCPTKPHRNQLSWVSFFFGW